MKKVIALMLVAILTLATFSVFAANVKFSDTDSEAVLALAEKGIITGYPDGTFRPDGNITRAEFAAVITRAKGLPVNLSEEGVTGFEDLDNDVNSAWARPYVKAAVDAGIINGFEDGTFRAAENITDEHAALMVERAFENIGISVENDSSLATREWVATIVYNALNPPEELKEMKKIRVLAFGNSYTDDSFRYLGAVGLAGGYEIYAVNMFKGSCALSNHYNYMKGEGAYTSRKEYMPYNMEVITTENVTFDEGLATDGGNWDYITLHQKGESSPFYEKYCPADTPYITELAKYINEKSPGSELLFFENWSVYTDRIEEREAYKPLLDGLEKKDYIPTVFASIKNSYLTAAEAIGNPNRVIPAGEAVYRAITKYGFEERVEGEGSTPEKYVFNTTARAFYRDTSSHMTFFYGRILVALTWYEYLTGEDARENPYQNENIPAEDMALLKEIAHEACSLPEYNPSK